jgi:hypothetical protein
MGVLIVSCSSLNQPIFPSVVHELVYFVDQIVLKLIAVGAMFCYHLNARRKVNEGLYLRLVTAKKRLSSQVGTIEWTSF